MQPTVCTIHRQLTCRTKCGLLSVYNTQAVDLQDKMQPTVCTIHRQLTCRTEGQLLMSAGGFLVFKCQVVTNSVAQVKSAQASNSSTRFYSHQLQLSPYLLLSLYVFYCMLCLTSQDAAKHQKTKGSSTPLTTKATATPTPHYKLNMRPTAKFQPISLSSPSRHHDKQRLFEGLEDSIGGGGGGGGSETFVPRRSIKKLNIKPKPTQVRDSPDPSLLPGFHVKCDESWGKRWNKAGYRVPSQSF